MSLFNEFMEAINRATTKWNTYKQNEAAYKGKVDAAQNELERLIGELRDCITRLIDLQGDYSAYISRITNIRQNMQILLNQQIEVIQESDAACNDKINQLKTQFEGFVNQIEDWEDGELRFEQLFTDLKGEIKRICDKADDINRKKQEREAKKQEFESEIELTEDLLDSKRRERTQDSSTTATETKRPEVQQQQQQQEPQEVEVDGLPDDWTAYRDPASQRTYYTHTDGRRQWELPDVTPRQQEESRQQGEDFGEEFNCATHPKARFGKDLREHIIGKMVEFGFRGIDRGGSQEINEAASKKLARYVDKLLTQPKCARVLKNLGYARGSILANNLLIEMTARFNKKKLIKGEDQRWRSADSSLGGGRRTRKKRGGWQTPQKLESISRYSPIRRVTRKKKNKKKKKKRRKKQTKKRRGKKRN